MDSYRLYGQAMLDFLGGGPGRFVFERDDGYRDPSDVRGLFASYRAWRPKAEQTAIRHARGRVLDVGCGPGRVALYLQRKGLAVTGIDLAPGAVEVARRRGVRDARPMDGCRPRFPSGAFDTLVMFGNNFGVCGGWEETKGFLRRARRITRRDGRLIASSRIPGTWIDHHAAYIKRNVRRGRPPGQLRLRIHYKGGHGFLVPALDPQPGRPSAAV